MADTPHTINVDGTTLTVALERKRVKNINARLRGTTLAVSAPMNVAQADLDQAITELARRLLRRVQTRQVNAEEDALAVVQRIAARFANRPVVAQVLFSANQRARWGSYSSATRTIPPECSAAPHAALGARIGGRARAGACHAHGSLAGILGARAIGRPTHGACRRISGWCLVAW